MSLLTQCPACQTYYRVVPDQLRISDGWVKCGQCSDIFDASVHLIEIETGSGSPDTAVRPNNSADATRHAITVRQDDAPALDLPREVPAGTGAMPAEMPTQAQGVTEMVTASDHTEDAVTLAAPVWAAQGIEPDVMPNVVPQLVFPRDEPIAVPVIGADPQSVHCDDALPSPPETVQPVQEQQNTDEAVFFLRGDKRLSVWHKPLVRGILIVLAAALVLMFAGQWAYRERDKLAASHPDLKPALQAACVWLNCVILPLRQIDALTIDSVAFNKLDKDIYKLSFLVKNASELPLAYPAVELVLTDAEDQPAYRRVLTNSELGSSKAIELAAGAEWPVTVRLRIEAPVGTQHVFGYRLLVFYP
jgi:predicted Zn finger-like uncharacterized protein